MPPKATFSTPLLHVAEIERSIPFYERTMSTLSGNSGPINILIVTTGR